MHIYNTYRVYIVSFRDIKEANTIRQLLQQQQQRKIRLNNSTFVFSMKFKMPLTSVGCFLLNFVFRSRLKTKSKSHTDSLFSLPQFFSLFARPIHFSMACSFLCVFQFVNYHIRLILLIFCFSFFLSLSPSLSESM